VIIQLRILSNIHQQHVISIWLVRVRSRVWFRVSCL